MADSFDLVVLGTGAGGSTPATKCRGAGWQVAVVDDQPYGGTCALRGCDPKKVLVGGAEIVAWHRRMTGYGIGGEALIEWPALMRFKGTFTDPVPANREAAFRKAGIETLHGEACFVAADRLMIGERELVARHVVVATGSGPRPLAIPGEDLVTTSTQFLELEALPSRVLFIGAGYVSFEFAHIARTAGAEVVVLERGRALPRFEEAVVERLVDHSRATGIDIRVNCPVTGVERTGNSGPLRVHAGGGPNAFVIETDLVVHGAGRVPNTARLNADVGSVHLDSRGGIQVNEFLQSTTNPRVYAAGDVALPPGSIPLTPVAAHEGAVVAANLLKGNVKRPDYRGIPSVVFTLPPLAGVGLTEKTARDKGLNVRIETGDTTGWYSNRRIREPVGMFKTVIDVESDRVVGAHLLGSHVDEVINLFALAVRFGIPAKELRHLIYAYPTSGSDVPYML